MRYEDVVSNVNVYGFINEYKVEDISKWKTIAYKLLPKTGM